MLREEDIVTAAHGVQAGQERIRDNQETMEARSLDSIFHDLAKYSHMIDWGDQKKRGGSCGEEPDEDPKKGKRNDSR